MTGLPHHPHRLRKQQNKPLGSFPLSALVPAEGWIDTDKHSEWPDESAANFRRDCVIKGQGMFATPRV